MNVFIVLSCRFPRMLRNNKERYGLYSKRNFTSKTNGFVHHHFDPGTLRNHWDNRSAIVYPNIISEIEETKLISILASKFQRRRYEQGHWDSVIKKYREVELFDEEADDLKLLLQPIRQFIEERHTSSETDPTADSSLHFSGAWLPCHAIDLHQDGELNAHVDSIRFSGNLVAGLSLLSDAIMRLKSSCDSSLKDNLEGSNTIESSEYIDLLLPRRSLYVLTGMSRYGFSHELLPGGSIFRGTTPIQRDRRISVIFRDTKT